MKWPGPFSLFKQLKKSILFKAKTIIIKSFLSLISAIVCTSIVLIFFQNCGRYNAGSASSGGSSLTVPSIIDEELRAKDVAPLNCNNQNSVAAGPPIESSQFIKAYGVMNGTNNGEYNNFSYIDQMNRAIGLEQSEVFKDIEDLKYNENKKICILKQKKIFCSKLPLVDINNSKTNNFYQLDSSYSFKQLLNFTRKSSFASSNDNVCALTEEGRLMCESSQILSNGNKKLIDQDLGTIYNQFISDSKWLCGQTIQNETRCAKFINENSDVNLNFSKIPDFEYVGRAGEVFFGANQKFIKISAVRNINEPFSSHYQLQFKSNIEESSEFFLATNGKIYIAASMDGVLTETSAENLNLFKNMQFLRSSGLFFDAQSQIIYSYNRSFQYNVEKILLSSTTNSKKISFLISDSLAIDEDGYLVGEGVGNLTFIKQQTISYNP